MNKNSKKIAVILSAIILVLCIGSIFVFSSNKFSNKVESIIGVDVNPSIELHVNKDEKVIKAISLNEEGKKILEDMDLKKVDLEVAINAIIGKMLKSGYVTSDLNSLLVSVRNNDPKKGEELQKKVTDEITSYLKGESIDASVLAQTIDDDEDDEIERLAEKYNISEGKAKLIQEVIDAKLTDAKGNLYSFESLVDLSVNELNLLLSSKNVKLENVNSSGKASESSYIGKEQAKKIALSKAKVSESKAKKIEVELDYENKIFVYEVEFRVGNYEYDYEINAISGEIINEIKKVDKDVDDDKYDKDDKDDKYDKDDYDDDDDDDKDDDDDDHDDDDD